MLRVQTSPVAVPAKLHHSIAGSVKCYGPLASPTAVPANHGIAAFVKCYGPDLAHNHSSKLQYCWLSEILRSPFLPITVPANHSIA